MKKVVIALSIALFIVYSASSNASVCDSGLNKVRGAPKNFKKFIDKHIGKNNLFNYSMDYSSLGLTSRSCPQYTERGICIPDSYRESGISFTYPLEDGLFAIWKYGDSMEMKVGEILDKKYSYSKVKESVVKTLGFQPDFFDQNGGIVIKLYGHYLQVSVYISGTLDAPRGVDARFITGPDVTTIQYSLNDVSYDCVKKPLRNQGSYIQPATSSPRSGEFSIWPNMPKDEGSRNIWQANCADGGYAWVNVQHDQPNVFCWGGGGFSGSTGSCDAGIGVEAALRKACRGE